MNLSAHLHLQVHKLLYCKKYSNRINKQFLYNGLLRKKHVFVFAGMHSPGEPIITSASPGDPYSIGKNDMQF